MSSTRRGGSNGLVFYSFFDIAKRGRPKETVDAQWADIVAVANEVKAREAVLLSEPGPAAEGAPDGIVCRTWRTADGGVTLLAVNALREPVECRIRVGNKTREISLPPLGVEFTAW